MPEEKEKEINFFKDTYQVVRRQLDNLKQDSEKITSETDLIIFKGSANGIKYTLESLFNFIKTPEESEEFGKIKMEYDRYVEDKIQNTQIEKKKK